MKNKRSLFILSVVLAVLTFVCNTTKARATSTTDTTVHIPDSGAFKSTLRGSKVNLYILKNKNNATVAITNYGGRVVSIIVPDKNGKPTDVVLGHDSIQSYQKPNDNCFGALIGRFGNRIAKGEFSLDGNTYHLDHNNGVNTLHSGFTGFQTRVFTAKQLSPQQLQLQYLAKDGEGGFPGNLTVTVVYTLTDDNAIKIEYTATTDKTTVVNLTNHSYFNLNGAGNKTITDHLLKINADATLPVDSTGIPTGQLEQVKGTPFDFTSFKLVGADIGKDDVQLKRGHGYDKNFVLNKHDLSQPVATLKSSLTGITMDVYTTEPGLQLYTGNFLNPKLHDGKEGAVYGPRSGICLETQHYPDSPNEPSFPSTVLKPGETYHTITIYKFSN
jgi:aldose 1-epimerase